MFHLLLSVQMEKPEASIFLSLQTTFSPHMPLTHLISILRDCICGLFFVVEYNAHEEKI